MSTYGSTRRATKIVVTLGPASSSPATIRELIGAGADVFRCNFSHGDHAGHGKVIAAIREAAEEMGRPVAIMQDLQGPKMRVGELAGGGPVELVPGASIELVEEEIEGTAERITVSIPGLAAEMRPGERVLLADGTMSLEVVAARASGLECRVLVGGLLKPHKGVNLPNTRLTLPCLTTKDLEDLEFGLARGVDYVALSFVRRPEDLVDLKERISAAGSNARVVAKVERPEAVRLSEEVLDATDVVMVARGDLGVELGAEKVPLAQKQIIQRAREKGVPVITATEMLETMTEAHRPTRAEASDVANAIEDGTSALMLSGETAVGRHPVQVVRTMDRIARYAEMTLAMPRVEAQVRYGSEEEVAEAVVSAAVKVATRLKARALVVFTRSGSTARRIGRYRLRVPVFAFTPNPVIQRQMSFYWGVQPMLFPAAQVGGPGELMVGAARTLREDGFVEEGDRVVMVAGAVEVEGTTHTLRVWRVGDQE